MYFGFFVIKSLALNFEKYRFFVEALAVSPSVIIDSFLEFLSFIKTQPSLFEAIADNTSEKEALEFIYGIFFPVIKSSLIGVKDFPIEPLGCVSPNSLILKFLNFATEIASASPIAAKAIVELVGTNLKFLSPASFTFE